MTAPSAKAAHTALPWHKCPTHGRMLETYSQTRAIVQAGKANLIAGVFGDVAGGEETAEANAELIVRAVNNHADLLAALIEAQATLLHNGIDTGPLPGISQRIRSAIAKATA